MRYTCDGFDAVNAANIMRAARIFATRAAHRKYGPHGRYRTLRLRTDRGAHGASFEALLLIPPPYSEAVNDEVYYFTVLTVREGPPLGNRARSVPEPL